jgi:predicted PurR-regulated permease PerM
LRSRLVLDLRAGMMPSRLPETTSPSGKTLSGPRHDLARVLLAVLSIGMLIVVSAYVLLPFLGALVWAITIVAATWPLMLRLQSALWGRRSLAVLLLSAALLLVLFIPLSIAISAIVQNASEIIAWVRSLGAFHLPPAPAWLVGLPAVGTRAAEFWDHLASSGIDQLAKDAAPYAATVATWLIAQIGNLGLIVLQFLLTVVLAAILYSNGEAAALLMLRFGYRLAGERGVNVMRLAGRAIRGVALGIVVTALVQSVLGGIALVIAGVPFAALLSGVMFVLCIAQVGPLLVMLPATIWMYWSGEPAWGTFLLVCTVLVATLDNVLRPFLIRKGADLPLLLIFAGVIGGLVAFGLIGIFVGPVVLAVTYTLLDAWMDDEPYVEEQSAAADSGHPTEPK